MKRRNLGNMTVSAIGMGCMGFSTAYGQTPSEEESIRLIRQAHDLGCTFFDTAEVYATYRNETLVGKALKPIRNEIMLCTKYSPATLQGQENIAGGKWSYAGVKAAVEGSLERLQTDRIDLYYLHRIPESGNVEDAAEWFGNLIRDGKIGGWGLSETTAEQIERANSVTPLTAVESEYSMMARKWEKDVLPLCEKLGIGFVAYAPLAQGFLSGKYTAATQHKGDDIRRVITRFSKENVQANQPVLDLIHKYAEEKGATAAQVSLAWLMHKYKFIVPIPGMRKSERIAENLGAAEVVLSDEEYAALTAELDKLSVYGDRSDEDIAKLGALRKELYGGNGMNKND